MNNVEQLYFDADFNNWDDFKIFQAGHKSRESEVVIWRTRNDKQEAKIINQAEEIKKLKVKMSVLKDAYAETFETYLPIDKLEEANELLLSLFSYYEMK